MHCVCVVRSRSCRLPARNEKEREKKKREREREGQPSPAARRKGRGCVCARAGRGEERDAAPMLLGPEPRVRGGRREGVYRVANHSRHPRPRPITYWFFTYDLIHYHSVIYICPARCGFRGFRGFREHGGWGGGGGREKKGKNKRGKKRNGVHTREVGRVA